MPSISALFLTFSTGAVGLALSADSGFDWGTDESDEEYESPFADETDEQEGEDDDPSAAPDEKFDWGTEAPDDEPDTASADDSAEGSLSASSSEAEPGLATKADARALCDEAMDLLHAGETARAFDRLGAHWAFSEDEMTQLQREVERTRAVVADRYGEALDYRLVREDTTADVLTRFVYLERFELHGLRWRFTVYEGAGGWTLNDVFFDDEIEALLDSA